MHRFETREARTVLREIVLVGLAGLASFLFINHSNLYFSGGFALSPAPIEAYFLATIVIYLFLRMVIIAAEMRPPRAHAELVRCPECGQWLDDPTPAAREAHLRIELTPKPSEKEIASSVALRKAVDAARLVAHASKLASDADLPVPTGTIENMATKDAIAAIDDPDLLERLRHSPDPPRDPRLRR